MSFEMDKFDYDLKSPVSTNYPDQYGEIDSLEYPNWRKFTDGFRRDPNAMAVPKGVIGVDGRVFDVEGAVDATMNSPLARSLKSRHLQMIAIGGSIGTGLFVSSGAALSTGGPASVVIAFSLIGIMLFCTVHALGEMAVLFPVAGSFSAYSTRFLDPAWGFAMGWNYAMQWLIALPLEITSACLVINFWDAGRINNDSWVIIFILIIAFINFIGVKGYGEAEFVFSIIKVMSVVGFIILGVILVVAGGPADAHYIGGKYWSNPGAFNNGFKGLCSVFVTAAFAFAGTELCGLAAAETANPRKSLPMAIKQVFWRITLFYVVSLALVGLLVPYNSPKLLGATDGTDTKASPFIIAMQQAGITVLPSVFNTIILIAVLSVGNSAVFGSSRTLAALAEQHQAPAFLAYIDRRGRPLVAICVSSAFGFLAFFAGSSKEHEAFKWMTALSGLSSIFTWGSICLAHIRFRKAWRVQGRTLEELPFRSHPGLIGSWIGFLFNALVLIAQLWTGIFPVGYQNYQSKGDLVAYFFSQYLAAPIMLACYIPYKFWFRTKVARAHEMDLKTGFRRLDLLELLREERKEQASWSRWKRWYKLFC
ncbi:MAG: glyceraldehyde-3-phosphate dehydrogenase 1 [Chrysothrix sp. TS-e1954]|nr:MAG: glyceraldehyde-3-phosphate dehydrogenase 1 [Chrysothrix sp. TS-e1954]